MTDAAAIRPSGTMLGAARHKPPGAAFSWLRQGWRDLWVDPFPSFAYGFVVGLAALGLAWALGVIGWNHLLLPSLAGFLVIGPVLAVGFYEKSRRLAAGEPAGFPQMLRLRGAVAGRLVLMALLMGVLLALWLQAAVLIDGLFFGSRPYPGFDQILPTLFASPHGMAMLATGTLVGALFAVAAISISVFSIPMLLDGEVGVGTAIRASVSAVWRNLPVMLVWAGIVIALTLVGILTVMAGFAIVFPLLGHATWRAYAAMKG